MLLQQQASLDPCMMPPPLGVNAELMVNPIGDPKCRIPSSPPSARMRFPLYPSASAGTAHGAGVAHGIPYLATGGISSHFKKITGTKYLVRHATLLPAPLRCLVAGSLSRVLVSQLLK
jgi:hypothetical protein